MLKVKCPYCGNENNVPDDRRGGLSFITCDVDDSPGCEGVFVIRIIIKKEVRVMSIGEETSNE